MIDDHSPRHGHGAILSVCVQEVINKYSLSQVQLILTSLVSYFGDVICQLVITELAKVRVGKGVQITHFVWQGRF